MKINTKALILTGLFAAITSVCALISIPVPFSPVPITLQLAAVFLSATILGSKYGSLSQIVYLLIGTVGLPVFSNFSGGPGVILGPTGGFLISFPIIAFIVGLIIEKNKNASDIIMRFLIMPLLLLFGLLICYSLGTLWLSFVLKISLTKAIYIGVLPFIPLDVIKAIFVSIIGYQIRISLIKAKLIN
ncbi:MAG: biotin transporter BioY [Clostridia bacterium]|jgi:biotin transport system substrate-specific component